MLCVAHYSTQSRVALMLPMIEAVMVRLLNMQDNWLYCTGSDTPPTQCNTPLFFKHARYVCMSCCIDTVSMIKSHYILNLVVQAGSDVTHTSFAPLAMHTLAFSLDRVNATTVWPMDRASFIPMVPNPPIPTIPMVFFLPSLHPWVMSGDHIVTPAHRIGAMLAAGMPISSGMRTA